MFKQDDKFEQIENSAVLWRYQDIPRYIDLLLKKQLFFSRADKFEDPYEGKYSLQSKQQMVNEIRDNKKENEIEAAQKVKKLEKEIQAKRTHMTISSWHQNTTENYAMWKIYAKGDYGLAIQTTYERLKKSFDATDKEVFIGKVNYYDESNKALPFDDPMTPFLRKRKIYEYENELRCCYVISEEDKEFKWQEQDKLDGVFIDADIDVLIERIYISPYSPDWIKDIIAGINEKFNIKKEIVHSKVFESEEY